MKKTTKKKLIIMAIFFIVIGFMYWFVTFKPDTESGSYIDQLTESQKLKNLRDTNKTLRLERDRNNRKIEILQDSIKQFDLLRSSYTNHIPKVKESLSTIRKQKEQAVTDNDFAGYVSQDSIYMDSVSGLILLYESVVTIQAQKSAAQDSIISTYIENEKKTETIFQNDIAIIKSRHRTEIDQLNNKLKRVKRQRNISLIGNAILTALVFWKK